MKASIKFRKRNPPYLKSSLVPRPMTTAPSLSRGRLGRRLWPQKAHLWSTTPGWLMVRPEEGSGSHGGGEPFLRVSSGACMCVARFQGTEVSPVLCFEKTQRLKRPQETGLLSASRIPLVLCFPPRNYLQPIRCQGTLSYVCVLVVQLPHCQRLAPPASSGCLPGKGAERKPELEPGPS